MSSCSKSARLWAPDHH